MQSPIPGDRRCKDGLHRDRWPEPRIRETSPTGLLGTIFGRKIAVAPYHGKLVRISLDTVPGLC